jgi:hypothetical protein
MTLQQTLTIPKTTTHLSVDLSEPIPAGTATFWLEWAATDSFLEERHRETDSTAGEQSIDRITAELRELCKGSTLTVDRLLEMKREEIALEDAQFRRLFPKDSN